MAFIIKDRVKEGTVTTGTGTFALGGAASTFEAFNTYMSNGDTAYYAVVHTASGVDEWEVGLGTFNTGNTLTRTTILSSSNSGNAVSFSSGTKDIFMTYPADRAVVEEPDRSVAFPAGISVTGNVAASGTIDGRDVAADGTKLDGIETAATADQTAAEIRTLVESATDSNVFTDTDHSKLNAIEASATADQTASEIRALVESATDSNVFTDADHTKLDGIEAGATADQTAAQIKVAYESNSDTNEFSDAEQTKLSNIEANATADQTAAEIKTLVGSATDSNVFTDADHTKLDGIETAATADQTKADIEGLGIDVPATNLTGTIPAARLSTATTQAESDDSTKIATTAYVTDKITTLIGGAPSTLNDLNELAAAINDDANYNTTLTTALATKLPLAGGALTGAVTTNSTFDGRDVAADGTKLDGIEANATGDQTNAEIRAAVEAATDSNVFTDADHSKLNGIEASANVTDTANVVAALTAGTNVAIASNGTISSTDTNTTYSVGDGGLTQKNFTTTLKSKLDGIETSAKDDQTITAGSGLSGGGTGNVTLSHSDTSSQASVNGSGRTYIQDITLDTYGHVTGLATATETVVNTDTNTTYSVGDGGLTQKNFTTTLKTKLDGIATNANNYSFPYTVSSSAGNSTVVQRSSSGYIFANYLNTTANDVTSGVTRVMVETGNDNYIRHGTAAAVRLFLNVVDGATNVTNNNQISNGAGYTTYTSNQATNTNSTVTFTTVNAGTFNTTSDERAKEDITPITGALNKVQQLGGYSFTLKETDEKSSGVIAQEVQKVMPELVQENDEGLLSVQYGNMVGLLIEAIKEQQTQIDELKEKLNS